MKRIKIAGLVLALLAGPLTLEAAATDRAEQLVSTQACPGCGLPEAILAGLNLSGVDLTGADLRGADLRRAIL
jgi:uncharacterized protein YjbI with pentapeptide repeats